MSGRPIKRTLRGPTRPAAVFMAAARKQTLSGPVEEREAPSQVACGIPSR